MREVLLLATLIALAAPVTLGQVKGRKIIAGSIRNQSRDSKQSVVIMDRELIGAYIRGDVAKLERMLADDFSSTGSGGMIDKSQYIAAAKDPFVIYESLSLDDNNVRIYEDTAVSTGRAVVTVREGAKRSNVIFRYTTVYVRRQNNWQAVALQATRIEQEQPNSES